MSRTLGVKFYSTHIWEIRYEVDEKYRADEVKRNGKARNR
jgi:hypothetical protein